MKLVYLVRLLSSGECWNTIVCATKEHAGVVLRGYAMIPDDDTESYWHNPYDRTQTANVFAYRVMGV